MVVMSRRSSSWTLFCVVRTPTHQSRLHSLTGRHMQEHRGSTGFVTLCGFGPPPGGAYNSPPPPPAGKNGLRVGAGPVTPSDQWNALSLPGWLPGLLRTKRRDHAFKAPARLNSVAETGDYLGCAPSDWQCPAASSLSLSLLLALKKQINSSAPRKPVLPQIREILDRSPPLRTQPAAASRSLVSAL